MSDSDHEIQLTEHPPSSFTGILRRLGPGLIVAGSIVGSGELIATTKTGAEAGFWLLWLIVIGCVIKVFVQVEFGRYSIVSGETTMHGLNSVPGPAVEISSSSSPDGRRMRANWIVWYWFLMWFASIGQLGGIVGGVGQALAISIPLTEEGRKFNEFVDRKTQLQVKQAELGLLQGATASDDSARRQAELETEIAELQQGIATADKPLIEQHGAEQLKELQTGLDLTSRNEDADVALAARLGTRRFLQLVESATLVVDGRYQADVLRTELGRHHYEHEMGNKPDVPNDDKIWATIIAVATSIILVAGRYGMIQTFSTVMVCGFTIVTVVNLAFLQANASWRVASADIVQGLSFRLPNSDTALITALATFGIIGVGASELITYPYWCLEKGYARFTGKRDKSDAWKQRAAGWMRVMRWDAWLSMVVYTFATVAFYLLGAAILGRTGLNPEKSEMIRTLAVMYEPVFTERASMLFLFGAFAVLYSTYFVANASHARVFSDTLGVLGAATTAEDAHRRRVTFLSGFFPLLCVAIYIFFPSPAQLVLLSGLMQAVMLPMLAIAGLYFRYYCNDERIAPGKLWDLFLWVSAIGMGVAGIWALVSRFI